VRGQLRSRAGAHHPWRPLKTIASNTKVRLSSARLTASVPLLRSSRASDRHAENLLAGPEWNGYGRESLTRKSVPSSKRGRGKGTDRSYGSGGCCSVVGCRTAVVDLVKCAYASRAMGRRDAKYRVGLRVDPEHIRRCQDSRIVSYLRQVRLSPLTRRAVPGSGSAHGVEQTRLLCSRSQASRPLQRHPQTRARTAWPSKLRRCIRSNACNTEAGMCARVWHAS
jgi:hypothetical protein